MRLTSDYRRVMALFETPLEEEVGYEQSSGTTLKTNFQVGPFAYTVLFSHIGYKGSLVNVEF